MNGELTAIDHDLFDRIIEVGAECCLEVIGDLVEVAAVRALGGTWQDNRGDKSAVARHVGAAVHTKLPEAMFYDLGRCADVHDRQLNSGLGNNGF